MLYKLLIMMSASILSPGPNSASNFEFGAGEPDLAWQAINDTVMGGQSTSQAISADGDLLFSGFLSTDGGGFASVRSARQAWDLSAFAVVRLHVLGDGREYRFRLYVDDDRASYQHAFTTVAGAWRTVDLPIQEFYASWRGRRLSRPALAPGSISGLGVILADGIDGEFNLRLGRIEFRPAPESK